MDGPRGGSCAAWRVGGEAGRAPSGGLRSCACSRTGWGRHHHHRDSWHMYDLYNVSIVTLVIVCINPSWYVWVDRIIWLRMTFLRQLDILILRRPMLLAFFVWRLKICVICIALFVRSWRRQLLPKYSDYTTSNDFELHRYVYIHTHTSRPLDVEQSLHFGSKLPSTVTY